MVSDQLTKYGKMFGKGAVIQMAPSILRGFVGEALRDDLMAVSSVNDWVKNKESLWDKIPPEWQDSVVRYGKELGDLEWLDSDWVIDVAREAKPGLASLFLGWKKARNWLDRQVVAVKTHIESGSIS